MIILYKPKKEKDFYRIKNILILYFNLLSFIIIYIKFNLLSFL